MAKPDGEGFLTIAEAAEMALAELGEGNPDDPETDDPSVEGALLELDGQAEDEDEEQPETEGETEAPSADTEEQSDEDEDESDDESLFGDIEVDDDEEEATPPVDLDSMKFELPGVDEAVSLQELKEGYLRQADYTRKRQADAEKARALEQEFGEAKRIYSALREDPLGFFQSLAKQLGVEGVEVHGAKNPDFKFNDAESFEAEVERAVQDRLNSDPELVQARQLAARARVDADFDRIQADRGVTITVDDRKKVLEFAIKNEIGNLDVAFDALMARVQAKRQAAQAKAERAKKTATKRPTGRVGEQDVTKPPTSVEEAMRRAAAEIAAAS